MSIYNTCVYVRHTIAKSTKQPEVMCVFACVFMYMFIHNTHNSLIESRSIFSFIQYSHWLPKGTPYYMYYNCICTYVCNITHKYVE